MAILYFIRTSKEWLLWNISYHQWPSLGSQTQGQSSWLGSPQRCSPRDELRVPLKWPAPPHSPGRELSAQAEVGRICWPTERVHTALRWKAALGEAQIGCKTRHRYLRRRRWFEATFQSIWVNDSSQLGYFSELQTYISIRLPDNNVFEWKLAVIIGGYFLLQLKQH